MYVYFLAYEWQRTDHDQTQGMVRVSKKEKGGGEGKVSSNDTGAHKRQYGGGHFTPYPKKKVDKQDIKRMESSLRQGAPPAKGGGTSSQPNYIGPNAHKALQILNSQGRINHAPMTPQPNVGGDTPNTSSLNSTLTNMTVPSNFPNPLNLANSFSLTQSQMCKKQSTLDSHVISNVTLTLNFPTPGIAPPQT